MREQSTKLRTLPSEPISAVKNGTIIVAASSTRPLTLQSGGCSPWNAWNPQLSSPEVIKHETENCLAFDAGWDALLLEAGVRRNMPEASDGVLVGHSPSRVMLQHCIEARPTQTSSRPPRVHRFCPEADYFAKISRIHFTLGVGPRCQLPVPSRMDSVCEARAAVKVQY